MGAPRLIAITDIAQHGPELTFARALRLCEAGRAGTVLLQLRDRGLPLRDRLAHGLALREIASRFGQGLAVNDRLDVALLVRADAVHLGEASVEIADARRMVPGREVYRAVHDVGAALGSDADAVVLSPVLAPRKGAEPLGLAALQEYAAARRARAKGPRLYALGGVDAAGAAACLAAGADGVAVQGAAWTGDIAALLDALDIAR
ncbi:MAG: thiamine phosphate synthase [Polyangiaceae bacterium]